LSTVQLTANGNSAWLPVKKDQPVEVTAASWAGGLSVTVQTRLSPDGAVHTAQKDGADWIVSSANDFGVADASCELRITTSTYGSSPVTLRRGKV
jgi:hypothetical protein